MEELTAYIASLAIGLSLGLIGAGGSILTIPVFVYVLKKDPSSSGIYSMFVVGISAMAGSIQSLARKLVDLNTVVAFGLPSVAGVLIARKLIFHSIPSHISLTDSISFSKDGILMLCLSLVMALAAIRMLKPLINVNQEETVSNPSVFLLLIRGLSVGLITGLLGIGGGFLIVPALFFLARLPIKKSIGTALVIITLNSIVSFLTSCKTISLDWSLLWKFSIGAILGMLIGTKLASKIEGDLLKKIFGWFILIVSIYIAYKQIFL